MPKAPSFATVRTSILLAVGIFGILYETIVGGTDRPALLVAFLMLCGFPLVLNVDKLIRTQAPEPPAAPPTVPPAGEPEPVKEAAP